MPLYEYECEACGQRFELIRKFSDPPVDVCAVCGKGPVTRLLSSPAIQFKGSGFYITDYVKKGEGGKGEGGAGKADGSKATAKSETKSDGTASEAGTKTDTKSDSSGASGSSTSTAPAKTSGTAKD